MNTAQYAIYVRTFDRYEIIASQNIDPGNYVTLTDCKQILDEVENDLREQGYTILPTSSLAFQAYHPTSRGLIFSVYALHYNR